MILNIYLEKYANQSLQRIRFCSALQNLTAGLSLGYQKKSAGLSGSLGVYEVTIC